MFTCKCGRKVSKLQYIDGEKSCEHCNPTSLSGQFERRLLMDRQVHERDILQAWNPNGTRNEDFIKVYGETIYKKRPKPPKQ